MSTYDLWEVSGKLAGKAKEFTDPAAARKAVTASKVPAALVHGGKVHTWSPSITAAQKAVLSAALATQGGEEIEPPGPLAVKAIPPRARVAVRSIDAVEPAAEDPGPGTPIAGRVMHPSMGPCVACGEPSAPYSDKLHPALRDLCDVDRQRAQKRRSAHQETPEDGRVWVVALVHAKAKGEPPPGRATQGGPGKSRKAAKAAPSKLSRAKRAPAPVEVVAQPPVPTLSTPPTDLLARVAGIVKRAGGIDALEAIVAQVEQIRAVA